MSLPNGEAREAREVRKSSSKNNVPRSAGVHRLANQSLSIKRDARISRDENAGDAGDERAVLDHTRPSSLD